MKIYIAEHAGYCFGVKRAVDTAIETIKDSSNMATYSLGPLIHNSQVVDKLYKDGLKVVEKIDELDNGKIVIRAHGIPFNVQKKE